MQVKKEYIRKNILEAAKVEFSANGFKDTSMREIARRAKTSTGNIYKYYRDKNKLLIAVLDPLMEALDNMFGNFEDTSSDITVDVFTSEEYKQGMIAMEMELTTKYRDELNLLINKSYGSGVKIFYDKLIERYTEASKEYMRSAQEKFPELDLEVSELFLKTNGHITFLIMGEIVSHDLTIEETKKYLSDFLHYSSSGWEAIMSKEKKNGG